MCVIDTSYDIPARFDHEFIHPEKVKEIILNAGYSDCGKDWPTRLLLLSQAWAPYLSERDVVNLSLSTNRFTGMDRFYGPAFQYRAVKRQLTYCSQSGLLNVVVGKVMGHLDETPKQTTFCATDQLRSILAGCEIRFVDHDPIRLHEYVDCKNGKVYSKKIPGRTYKRRLKAYEDTPETINLRRDIRQINSFISGLRVNWCDYDKDKGDKYTVFDANNNLETPLSITRVFARGSFDCYGRCHGFWQYQKKERRKSILLNEMETCEPDYSSLHANLAYLELGQKPPENPYHINGFYRTLIKRAFSILLNAGDLKGAVSALAAKMEITQEYAENAIDAVKLNHPLIIDQFHSDAGIGLMRIDSDICVSVMLELVRERIPFLPIHDSFRVPIIHEDQTKQLMQKVFKERYPDSVCRVV